jgi:hypothetical protein
LLDSNLAVCGGFTNANGAAGVPLTSVKLDAFTKLSVDALQTR